MHKSFYKITPETQNSNKINKVAQHKTTEVLWKNKICSKCPFNHGNKQSQRRGSKANFCFGLDVFALYCILAEIYDILNFGITNCNVVAFIKPKFPINLF